MSAILKTPNPAKDPPRRRFTVAEIDDMTRAGILHEHEPVELIEGELVLIASKGSFHERMKGALNLHWAQRLPPDLLFITETTLRLSVDTFLEPDFVVYPKAGGWNGMNAATARLVVEIADTSLAYDLGRKAQLYAGFGIVELWVVNAVTREASLHRDPVGGAYRLVEARAADERLVPVHAPDLAVTLADLEIH